MKLVYEGPHDEVEVAAAGVIAQKGTPVEISDDLKVVVNVDEDGKPVEQRLVDSLLEQSTWKKAGKAKDGDA